MSYLSFSKRWASHLTARTGLSSEKEVILAYIIEVLVLNLINVFLALMLGLLLGVLPGTAACLFTMFLFRHTAGGAHSNSPWRCGAVTITVYPFIALLAASLSTMGKPYFDILSVAAVLTGAAAVILMAPVDSPSAPIISPARRQRLKFLSLAVILLLTMILFMLQQSPWDFARQIQLSIVFSILWASFMLSKLGHQIFSLIDKIQNNKTSHNQ